MRLRTLLFLLLLLASLTLRAEPPAPSSAARPSLKDTAHDLEPRIAATNLTRPKGQDINEAMQCRLSALFDTGNWYFTKDDVAQLTSGKCYDKYCVGDRTPFDSTQKLFQKRNRQFKEWLLKAKEEPVNLNGNESVPKGLNWPATAKDEKDLEHRWKQIMTWRVVDQVLALQNQKKPADPKTVQAAMFSDMLTAVDGDYEFWSKIGDEQKEDLLVDARLRCSDKYAQVYPKSSAGQSVASVLGNYPVTNGLFFFRGEDGLYVNFAIPGSKAALSGKFKPGDKLESIKVGDTVFKSDDPKLIEFLNAEHKVGDPFEVTIKRGAETITEKLDYQKTIAPKSVVTTRVFNYDGKKFLVVKIPDFINEDPKLSPEASVGTQGQTYLAIQNAPPHDAVVLDLRNNGGGSTYEANSLAGVFLSTEPTITTRVARKPKDEFVEWKASARVPYLDKPLVLLVNQNSASASELLTAALREHNRGLVIGETTYGKGIEQVFQTLNDGRLFKQTENLNVGLRNDPFHKKGIKPDIEVPYVSGTFSRNREQQDVVDPTGGRRPAIDVTAGAKHWTVDPAAVARTRDWAEAVQKRAPDLKAYREALEVARGLDKEENLPLNLEKLKARSETIRAANEVIARSGDLTDWSVELATQYLKEAAAPVKK